MQRLETSFAKSEWRFMWLEHSGFGGQGHAEVLQDTDRGGSYGQGIGSALIALGVCKELDFPLSTMGSHLIYIFKK